MTRIHAKHHLIFLQHRNPIHHFLHTLIQTSHIDVFSILVQLIIILIRSNRRQLHQLLLRLIITHTITENVHFRTKRRLLLTIHPRKLHTLLQRSQHTLRKHKHITQTLFILALHEKHIANLVDIQFFERRIKIAELEEIGAIEFGNERPRILLHEHLHRVHVRRQRNVVNADIFQLLHCALPVHRHHLFMNQRQTQYVHTRRLQIIVRVHSDLLCHRICSL
mmetsp:Transcript_27063/g.42833  ORF Transcript_27063/g.42833 Transcript_27063/m.42833 type:complete len:222 (-) Transcript_27063:936-1601(-)